MRRIIISVMAVVALSLGAMPTASAYCENDTSSGGCTNSCKETGKVVTKVLKIDWNCPQ